jgi:hypothetical protein
MNKYIFPSGTLNGNIMNKYIFPSGTPNGIHASKGELILPNRAYETYPNSFKWSKSLGKQHKSKPS